MLQYPAKTFKKYAGRILLILPFLLFTLSCGGKSEMYSGLLPPEEAGELFEMEADAALAEPSLMRKSAAPSENASDAASSLEERIKSYRAGCTLKVPDPELSISTLGIIIKKYSGFIDSVNGRTVVLNVPAENLDKAFEEIKMNGELLSEYKEADDVTEYFYDLSGRIKLLENSKKRFSTLLRTEKDIEKKVKILKQIKRIDDELERLKTSLSSLNNRIKYSVITVTVVPFNEFEPDYRIPFKWIENLDPFKYSIKEIFRKVQITLPDDFAVLKSRRYFHAETSDGTVIRIGSVKNIPEGDTDFWQKALIYYLSRFYSKSEKADCGEVKGAVFHSKGNSRYLFFTGTYTKGPLLYVIEIYYPDETGYEKYSGGIKKSLENLRVR